MADNITLNVGTGGATLGTDEVTIGGTLQHVQRVKLVDGADGGTGLIGGDGSNGLDVDVTRVQGTVTVGGPAADGAPVSGNPVLTGGFDGTNVQSIATTSGGLVMIHDGSGSLTTDVPDGSDVTLGAKADAKSTATDTTAITAMSVWKQISASVQAIATSVAGTLTVASHAVTNAGTFAVQAAQSGTWNVVDAGDVAHDGVDSGNPVKVGGKAVSSEPTAVSAGDRTNFITDLVGKLIVLLYANPENYVSGAITSAMTSTTSTSLIAAPAAGLRNYITQITVSNSHATVLTDIVIQDGSGGTTLYVLPGPALSGSIITLPTPLRQPSTATAIFCANVTTGANTKVSASGYKGA